VPSYNAEKADGVALRAHFMRGDFALLLKPAINVENQLI
jgi:hypothetical protein